MRRLPACFVFWAPTPISFSVLLFLLSFIAFTIPSQFFALCNYTSGMCNIITRTLQWFWFPRCSGSETATVPRGNDILVEGLFFLHVFSFKNAISQQKTHISPERIQTSGPFTQIIVFRKSLSISTLPDTITDYNTAAVFQGRRFKY
jgi:hypothetical protein